MAQREHVHVPPGQIFGIVLIGGTKRFQQVTAAISPVQILKQKAIHSRRPQEVAGYGFTISGSIAARGQVVGCEFQGNRAFRIPIIIAIPFFQSPDRLVAGPGLIAFYLCGLWFVTRLRLTRERYDEITRGLAERGGLPPGGG